MNSNISRPERWSFFRPIVLYQNQKRKASVYVNLKTWSEERSAHYAFWFDAHASLL